jgi:hypothetical protein
MFGLSPGVPTAVAPNGMLEPTVADDAPGTGPGESAADMPELMLEDVAEPHPLETSVPPPSNAEFELALAQGCGLMPGVLNSVAPSGIPLEVGAEVSGDEDVPSGEVAPMPGVAADCACAAPTAPRQIKICKARRDRIKGSSPMICVCDAGSSNHRISEQAAPVGQLRKHAARAASSLLRPPYQNFIPTRRDTAVSRQFVCTRELVRNASILGSVFRPAHVVARQRASSIEAVVISDQKRPSNIVEFRPGKSGARPDRGQDKAPSDGDISRLIDLSRYERPTSHSDAFRARMAVNIAVLVLLVTLAVAAAADVVDIESLERGAPSWQLGFAAKANR